MARNLLFLMTDVVSYVNWWSLSMVMCNRLLSRRNIPGTLPPLEPGNPKFCPVVKWRILFHPLVPLGWRRRMKEIANSFPHVGIVFIKLFLTNPITVPEKIEDKLHWSCAKFRIFPLIIFYFLHHFWLQEAAQEMSVSLSLSIRWCIHNQAFFNPKVNQWWFRKI